jgi:thiol-disulfide isomerase/thioredoxin
MNNTTTIGVVLGTVLLAGGLIGFEQYRITRAENAPSPLLPLAKCLKEKGVVFYGAHWCEHCKNQKRQFGSAAKELPYVECSSPDGSQMFPVCIEAKVESFPTWVFTDGSRLSGEVKAAVLAEKSGCEMPK